MANVKLSDGNLPQDICGPLCWLIPNQYYWRAICVALQSHLQTEKEIVVFVENVVIAFYLRCY